MEERVRFGQKLHELSGVYFRRAVLLTSTNKDGYVLSIFKAAVVLKPYSIYRLIYDGQADFGLILHSRSQRLSIAVDLNLVSVER